MKKGWLIAGAIVGCWWGASLGACSSTSGGTGAGITTSSSSSSSGTASSSSGSASSSSSGGTGGTTTTTATSTCKSDPTIHTATAGSIFCGFGADGGELTCAIGTQCCIGGSTGGSTFADDDCEAFGTACMNPAGGGLAVQCEQPSDCTANSSDAGASPLCCLMGSAPTQVTGCDAANLKASGGAGTQCLSGSSCGTGNTQLCLQDTDCPTGTTCKAFRWKVIEMGACM